MPLPKIKETKKDVERLAIACLMHRLIIPHIWRGYKNRFRACGWGSDSPKFKSWLHHVLSVWSCSDNLFSLNLTVFICDREIINVPTHCDDVVKVTSCVFVELAKCFIYATWLKELSCSRACYTWWCAMVADAWFSCCLTVMEFLSSFSCPQTLAFHILNIYSSFHIPPKCYLLSECCSAPLPAPLHPPPTFFSTYVHR